TTFGLHWSANCASFSPRLTFCTVTTSLPPESGTRRARVRERDQVPADRHRRAGKPGGRSPAGRRGCEPCLARAAAGTGEPAAVTRARPPCRRGGGGCLSRVAGKWIRGDVIAGAPPRPAGLH